MRVREILFLFLFLSMIGAEIWSKSEVEARVKWRRGKLKYRTW